MKRYCYLLILLLLCCTQCKEKNTPTEKKQESYYDKGQVVFYGSYYAAEGILQNVLSLDIYSKGLSLDSAGYMVGSGVNLYLSDIFLPSKDTFLVATSYMSDTTGNAYTFLPGINYDGQISGAYLLTITDGSLVSAELFEEGSFTLTQKKDSVSIAFLLKKESGKNYAAEFSGVLPYYDGR